MSKKSQRRSQTRRDEVSVEDARRTLELIDEASEPALNLNALKGELLARTRSCPPSSKPLESLHEILRSPKRVVGIAQEEDLLTRSTILVDVATGEFFELKSRGVRVPNSMSEAGVTFLEVTRPAEDWARAKLSGRALRSDGTIH